MAKEKIALGCDHIGFELKELLKRYLIEGKGMEVAIDPVKTREAGNASFIETTDVVCTSIQKDECRLGLFICGTGLGFCSVANTYWGIRAAHASECYTAERARRSLNAQILCIGCRVLAPEYAKKIVDAFVDKPFDWGRESSVVNLKLIEEFEHSRSSKPEWVAWSMGFSPKDQHA